MFLLDTNFDGVNQKIRVGRHENARSHFLCAAHQSGSVLPSINLLSQDEQCHGIFFFFSRLITRIGFVCTRLSCDTVSSRWVKRVVSTETRVSLKRWNIPVVAHGRRTERGDKEGDKCERRRGTRAKKIYGVTRERKERNGRQGERKSADLGDVQKRLRWTLNRIDSRRKLQSANSAILLLKWISAVVLSLSSYR